ncbi:MAG: GTPase domain-containing protein, partial [Muribaculum sp.]|nr:GTPase domain-containing protein [Muribaculum sp.]
MNTAFEWISEVSGLAFISIKDKAIRIKPTIESYFEGFHCGLKHYQKQVIMHLVETTDISIEEILRRIAQYTDNKDDSIYWIDWRVKEILTDIDAIARINGASWFCEFSSLDRFHISKKKWIALISEKFSIGIKSYQMKPVLNANELAVLLSSLQASKVKDAKSKCTDTPKKVNSQHSIEKELTSIINFCQTQLSELNTTTFKHPQLADLRNQYISQLKSIIEEFMNLTNLIRNEIVWDHLVVAFFGETNAGKSTLIETLRLNYGVADTNSWNHSEIVGDGQADYTKDATEYDILVNGKRVTLIDVPGIEGDEAKYAEVIEKALRKAHVVFYVQGKNKKPDAKIAQKIGRYLSDWSRVYSIYNVRNSLDDYDPEMLNTVPDTLNTERNIDLQKQIQEVLKGILGNVYQGGLMLHGLVGLSVSSNFEQNAKWHNLHVQSLRLFGSCEKALEFSNISEWISLMNVCSDDFEKVIVESNRQKITGLKIKGMNMLKGIEKAQSSDMENLTNRLYSLKNSVLSLFSNSIRNVKQRPAFETNQTLNKLKSDLVDIVKSEGDTEHKIRRAKSKSLDAQYTLNSRIEDVLSENADILKGN